MTIETNINYWDCDCEHNYIHPKTTSKCLICGVELSEDQPDSMQNELSDFITKGLIEVMNEE